MFLLLFIWNIRFALLLGKKPKKSIGKTVKNLLRSKKGKDSQSIGLSDLMPNQQRRLSASSTGNLQVIDEDRVSMYSDFDDHSLLPVPEYLKGKN